MNTKLSLAVASALLAAASSASAGVMIPAGDWTLDIGGVVNAYYTQTSTSGDDSTILGLGPNAVAGGGDDKSVNNITTGLLPNYLSVSGKTRQNDVDVGFTISLQPGAATNRAGFQNLTGSNQENRQAFLTFGDASWGSIKLGKDLGIYASDAILNDMTLLGVGSGAGALSGNTTTLGRIGSGFMYADWKSQVAYSSPNWNGFNFTAGVTQSWNALGGFGGAGSTNRGASQPAFEAKASYAWAGDFGGKVWVSGISQKIEGISNAVAPSIANPAGTPNTATKTSTRADSFDIGANVNVAGFGLTGYYYTGDGIGQTVQFLGALDATGKTRDSDGWYVQATYTLPGVGTKLGASYGKSELEGNAGESSSLVEDKMWTVGAYHPLTKHLNLVAEYSSLKHETGASTNVSGLNQEGKAKTISLGAILFF